jgi:hypothetical protein
VEHADNLDKDVGGLFLLILIMAYVVILETKYILRLLKSMIFFKCPHRTSKWLHVEAPLFFRLWMILRWLHVEASKGDSN